MPSKSDKQKSFMQAIAANPEFAKKVKVPAKVGKEFVKADAKQDKKIIAKVTKKKY
jgi:hypothetical protein